MSRTERPAVSHGDRINAADIAETVTRAPFTDTDGATQVFTHDGRTTYVEKGSQSSGGEWRAGDQGRFWPFWPPTYRATYDASWITGADGDVVSGESRRDVRGTAHSRARLTRDEACPRALLTRDLRRGCIRCIPRIGAPVREARVVVGPRQASGPRRAPGRRPGSCARHAPTLVDTRPSPVGSPATDRYEWSGRSTAGEPAPPAPVRAPTGEVARPSRPWEPPGAPGESGGARPADGAASALDIDRP